MLLTWRDSLNTPSEKSMLNSTKIILSNWLNVMTRTDGQSRDVQDGITCWVNRTIETCISSFRRLFCSIPSTPFFSLWRIYPQVMHVSHSKFDFLFIIAYEWALYQEGTFGECIVPARSSSVMRFQIALRSPFQWLLDLRQARKTNTTQHFLGMIKEETLTVLPLLRVLKGY